MRYRKVQSDMPIATFVLEVLLPIVVVIRNDVMVTISRIFVAVYVLQKMLAGQKI